MTENRTRTPAQAAAEVLSTGGRRVDLDVSGMTCASCVGRVERKLGKIDGSRPR